VGAAPAAEHVWEQRLPGLGVIGVGHCHDHLGDPADPQRVQHPALVVTAEQVISRMLAATPDGIRCSVGIAIYDGHRDTAEVLASADDAMYRNKTKTRAAPVIDTHTPQSN